MKFFTRVLHNVQHKTISGNDNQEMEPFATGIDSTDSYGTSTSNLKHTQFQHDENEDDDVIVTEHDLGTPYAEDVSDFSISRAVGRVDTERRKIQNLTPLRLSIVRQNPTLGSPDSDTDILGYLDHTPDPYIDSADNAGSISFSKVFHLTGITELMPGAFIPECPVHLNITRIESINTNIGLKIFASPVLNIELEHGDFKWNIRKKVSQVANLHSQLLLLRTKLKLPAATREARIRRQSMRIQMKRAEKSEDAVDDTGRSTASRLVKFPRRALQSVDASVQSDLQTYLRNILCHSLFRSHQLLLEFLEVSPLSFIKELGIKNKEGFVKKRVGTYNSNGCCTWCVSPVTGRYKQKWLVLKDTCLFFLSPENGEVRTVMIMDSNFEVSHGYRVIGVRNSLLISNLNRSVLFKCENEATQKEWVTEIKRTQEKYARPFTAHQRRYDSFAPVREGSYARWYVDGSRYMWDVAEMLESAKEEIFITDWWLSPEIYLKRPDLTGSQWRLAEVLKRQAERGVQVFILLYKEVELALGISSILTKQTLGQLHHNIKILRHPDHYAGGVLYWAHHEKMVIIDQMYAFVSGIDLAFGRWDDSRHKLVDVGHAGVRSTPSVQSQVTQGLLGSAVLQLVKGTNEVLVPPVTHSGPNSRRSSCDISLLEENTLSTTVSSILSSPIEIAENHRTNTNDGADGESVQSETDKKIPTIVLSRPDVKSDDVIDRNARKDSLPVSSIENVSRSSSSMKSIKKRRFLKRGHHLENHSVGYHRTEEEGQTEGRMGKGLKEVKKKGLELVEEVKEKGRGVRAWTATKLPQLHHRRNSSGSEISDTDDEDEDGRVKSIYKFRQRLGDRVKMGSTTSLAQAHSALTKEDTTSIHLWVGKDYVNWISKDLTNLDKPFKDIVDRHQLPRMPWHDIGLFVEGPAARDAARHFIQRWNAVKSEKAKPDTSYPYLIPRTYSKKSFIPSHLVPKHRVKCQVLRSVSKWSAGLEESEFSIMNAYIDLIRKAKHYIYIENQFFITCAASFEAKEVSNLIAQEIVERILKAHSNNEVFRVFILLPLLPAFEGMIGKSSGVAMQYIVYWNYVSICRGKSSLVQCLIDNGISDWRKYVSFCSLRNHEELEGRPVSELIYIHSKMMIVDDRYVIAGSANINDRSLIGNRDSEVCMVMEDEEFENSIMNGQPYESGVFGGSMRRYLFSEHLGISDDNEKEIESILDPVAEHFFTDIWCSTAAKNTQIFEEVFSCYPCDSAKTFEDVDKLRGGTNLAEVNPLEAMRRLKEVKGHLVQFPLEFLKDEVLKPGVGTKEYLLPIEMWI